MTNTLVSIVSVKNLEEIELKTKQAIDLIGGMNEIVKKGDLVLLKPNFVAPRQSYTGTVTDLNIVKKVIDEVRDCGGEPILGDMAGIEFDTERTLEILGVKAFAKKMKVKIVDFLKHERVDVKITDGVIFRKLKLSKIVFDSDVIINIPKVKTHNITIASLGMKNLMGFLTTEDRRWAHINGIDQAILDLNKVIRPQLTIADGVIAMNGDGAVYGDPVRLGVIAAGKKVAAVDKVCCQIMGLDPRKVPHIELAYKSGFESDIIKIKGESIDNISKITFGVKKGQLYRQVYRGMYAIDYVYSRIFKEKTIIPRLVSIVGTKPRINSKICNYCGICENVCPVKAIRIDWSRSRIKIDRDKCMRVRCLLCFEACPQGAINVKGFSHPRSPCLHVMM